MLSLAQNFARILVFLSHGVIRMVFCRKSIELSARATDLAMGSVFYILNFRLNPATEYEVSRLNCI